VQTLKLPVVITQDEDVFYLAEVPILRSCFTQGKTKEEAISNLKEVINLCLESIAEEGGHIPEKYSLEQIEVAV
jgi:predicted RNase H-like HicB family nuclease